MSPGKLARLLYRHTGPHGLKAEHGMYVTQEYLTWRDTPRRWKWVQSSSGNYVQVEDK